MIKSGKIFKVLIFFILISFVIIRYLNIIFSNIQYEALDESDLSVNFELYESVKKEF